MLRSSHEHAAAAATAEHAAGVAGWQLVRYGLVIVIAWIGALTYTTYEATAIQPLIAHSPMMRVLPGQFLLKDLVLLGASAWALGYSLGVAMSRASSTRLIAAQLGPTRPRSQLRLPVCMVLAIRSA
jgi:Protein of unknown function, DUF417